MKICTGASRTVILIGRFAFKFPRIYSWKMFLFGLLGNINEREFSNAGYPELCPVVFSVPGGFLTVMRRALPLTDEQWNSIDVEAWRNRGEYIVPVEDKMSSFGRLYGKIVAVDYGSGY